MAIPSKLLLSDLLKHNVRCDIGLDHGPGTSAWMHPPVHRILGWVSRPSSLQLKREVWRLDQLRGLNDKEVYVKGIASNSDEQTLERFPTLINANVFNRKGERMGLIADFVFDTKNGNIQYYLISRSNPLIPGTSRWRLNLSQISDMHPGSISCDINSLEDLLIQKSSLKEEFLNKGRKWKTQLQDFTYGASDRLEGWIEEQIGENGFDNNIDQFQNETDSDDEWIDNLDMDSSQQFNTMKKREKKTSTSNERDFDPWI